MKKQTVSSITAFLLLFSLIFNSAAPPVAAQDLVGGASEDLQGGASVFVFRGSRNQAHVQSGFRALSLRTTAQRKQVTRARIKTQVAVVAKTPRRIRPSDQTASNQNRPGNNRPGNNRPGNNRPGNTGNITVAEMKKEKAAEILAIAGEQALAKNDFDEAERKFKEVQKLNPDNEKGIVGLIKLYNLRAGEALEAKDYQSAIDYYAQTVALDRDNAEAYAGLGEAYDENNMDAKAVEAYENALRANAELTEINEPLGRLYYAAGNLQQAEKYLARAASANQSDLELQNAYALTLYKQNRSEDALRIYQTVAKLDPNSAEARFRLGGLYDQLNRKDEAVAEYEQTIKLNDKNAEAFYNLGVLYYNRAPKDNLKAAMPFYEKAAAAYQKAISLKGDYIEARANLADVYRQMQKYNDAANQYNTLQTFKPRDADLLSKFGYCLGKSKNWALATKKLEEAAAINPEAIDYTNLSWAYSNAGKVALGEKIMAEVRRDGATAAQKDAESKQFFAKARQAGQTAVQKDPNFAGGYFNLGNAQAQLGDGGDAIKAFQNAVRLRAGWAEAHNNLGYAYGITNQLDKAAAEHRAAIAINDNLADAHANLAVVLTKMGNTKEARKELERVQQLNPSLAAQLNSLLGTLSKEFGRQLKNKTVNKLKNKFSFPF